MNNKNFLISLTAASFLLSGCANDGRGQKEGFGTLLGGIGGAVAGAQFGKGSGRVAMGAAGALLGAFVGNQIGQSLDKADAMYAQQAANRALETAPSGQAIAWKNPDSGHSGSIAPIRTMQNPTTGQYCREYQQTINVGGQQQQAYGTACRQPDGSWKVMP